MSVLPLLLATLGEAQLALAPASVTVHPDRAVRVIPREIFGVNLEWTLNASGLWDPEAKAHYEDRLREVKSIGFGSLRYPGGTLSDYFHWQGAIGDAREEQLNPFYKHDNAPKTRYPYYGPAEFLQTVDALDATPWLTANVGTGTAEEAAAWAEWCRQQGHEVTHWEIGNEMYLKADFPEGVDLTPQEYATKFSEFTAALRAVSPGYVVAAIGQMPAVGIIAGAIPNTDWNSVVIGACAKDMDCLALHHAYAPMIMLGPDGKLQPEEKVYQSLLGASLFVRTTTDAILELIRRLAPDRADHISLAVTEHEGLFYPLPNEDLMRQVRPNRTLGSAIYLSTLYNLFITEPAIRYAHKMTLITPVFGGVLSTGWEPGGAVWPNPHFWVCQEYARTAGQTAVECEVNCGTYSVGAVGFVPDLPAVPYVDVSATKAESGELTVFLVNRSLDAHQPVAVTLDGVEAKQATATVLTGPKYDVTNDSPTALAASPRDAEVALEQPLRLDLPPCSLTVLRCSP